MLKYILICALLTSCALFEKKSSQSCQDKTQTKFVTKDWPKQSVYFLLVDRFANGDTSNDGFSKKSDPLAYHGGDLKGLIDELGHIKKTGAGTLLMTPIMDNRDRFFFGSWGFHGYWIIDHYRVDEHFGDRELFADFTKKRTEMGFRFLLDITLNHVDWDHPWTKSRPDWFHARGDIKNWDDPVELVEGRVTGLPDLDQDNPSVYRELLKFSKYWIDLSKADGLRLDAAKHIDHGFWKKYICDIKKHVINKRDFLFLAENLHGDPNQYKPYYEDGFNAFYDYPLYYTIVGVFTKNYSMFDLANRLQGMDRAFPDNVLWVTFLDNHDVPRFLNVNPDVSIADLNQALAFIFTTRGMPLVYYGTEEFMTGKTAEEGRMDLTFIKSEELDYLKKLTFIRASSPSLYSGIREDLIAKQDTYVFRQTSPEEESLVIFHRGKAETLHLPIEEDSLFRSPGKVCDRISEKCFKTGSSMMISLKGHDAIILTRKGVSSLHYRLKNALPPSHQITFTVTGTAKKGETFHVIGDDEFLGNWDASKSVPMKSVGIDRHEAHVSFPLHRALNYKFIKRKANGTFEWGEGWNWNHFVTGPTTVTQKWVPPKNKI
jgi:alpha-amylase